MRFFWYELFCAARQKKQALAVIALATAALVSFSASTKAQMFMMPVDEDSGQQSVQDAPESSSSTGNLADTYDQPDGEGTTPQQTTQETGTADDTSLLTDNQFNNYEYLIFGIPQNTKESEGNTLFRATTLLTATATTLTTLTEKFQPADPAALDFFGWRILLDGNTIFISSPGLASTNRSGKVYVYEKTGTSWSLQQQLIPAIPDNNLAFGTSLSLSGSTLAIGAMPVTNAAASVAGKVYLFEFDGTDWLESEVLAPASPINDEEFGRSVYLDATSGLLVVGAPGQPGTNLVGRAFIYEEQGGSWQLTQVITPSPAPIHASFGFDVLAIGTEIFVNATNQDNGSISTAGGVYVFEYDSVTGLWNQSQELLSDNPANYGQFGYDLETDGSRLLISATGENSSTGADSGVIHVFEKSGTNWGRTGKIEQATPVADALFGLSMDLSGSDLLVGAISDNSFRGAAYLFSETGGTFQETEKFLAADSATFGSNFGAHVALGTSELHIGDPYHSEKGTFSGAVYSKSFTAPPATFFLTVDTAGTGTGTIASSLAGIDCGSDCSEEYPENTIVTLFATADPGSVFNGWGGDADCSDGIVTMTADITCIAQFDLAPTQTYTLTVTTAGTGTGTVTSAPVGIDCGSDCDEAYDENTIVTLTATADSGSTFHSWSGDADCLDNSVVMDADKTCTANFEVIQEPTSLWTQAVDSLNIFRLLGKVGIGTSNPQEALHVVGNIKADGICIGNDCRTEWPSGQQTDPSGEEPLPLPEETEPEAIIEFLEQKLREQKQELRDLIKEVRLQERELRKLERELRRQARQQ